MSLLYLVIVCFVTSFLLFLPIFPFWKFAQALKQNYSKVWFDKGPFGLTHMLAHAVLISTFFKIVQHAADAKAPFEQDKDTIKWARISAGLYIMRPKTFFMQIVYFFVFVYFVVFFTSVLSKIIGV